MTTAIRYYSKFGHSAKMAEIVGQIVGTKPETVNVPIDTEVETLYLGAGVFLGKVDGSVERFINTLTPEKVKRVVCFGSCAIIDSPVPQMRKLLEARGIDVDEQSFTCRGSMGPLHAGHPNQHDLDNLRQFIEKVK